MLISIFYMFYMKPKVRQFSNSVLVRRGKNVKNGCYCYNRMCVYPHIERLNSVTKTVNHRFCHWLLTGLETEIL